MIFISFLKERRHLYLITRNEKTQQHNIQKFDHKYSLSSKLSYATISIL